MKRFFRFILFMALFAVGWHIYQNEIIPREKVFELAATEVPDWIDQQIIKVDGDSRRGVYLEGIRNIVIHYVGNPGSTAQQNRDYYVNPSSNVSSHFVMEDPIGISSLTQELGVLHLREENKLTGTNFIPLFYFDKVNKKLLVLEPTIYMIKEYNASLLADIADELEQNVKQKTEPVQQSFELQ